MAASTSPAFPVAAPPAGPAHPCSFCDAPPGSSATVPLHPALCPAAHRACRRCARYITKRPLAPGPFVCLACAWARATSDEPGEPLPVRLRWAAAADGPQPVEGRPDLLERGG